MAILRSDPPVTIGGPQEPTPTSEPCTAADAGCARTSQPTLSGPPPTRCTCDAVGAGASPEGAVLVAVVGLVLAGRAVARVFRR